WSGGERAITTIYGLWSRSIFGRVRPKRNGVQSTKLSVRRLQPTPAPSLASSRVPRTSPRPPHPPASQRGASALLPHSAARARHTEPASASGLVQVQPHSPELPVQTPALAT